MHVVIQCHQCDFIEDLPSIPDYLITNAVSGVYFPAERPHPLGMPAIAHHNDTGHGLDGGGHRDFLILNTNRQEIGHIDAGSYGFNIITWMYRLSPEGGHHNSQERR